MNILLFGRVPRSPSMRRLLLAAARAGLGPLARRRGELCVVFCPDAEMRRLNRAHLGRNRTTDVIAFLYPPQKGVPHGETLPFGDVYVGSDAARRQGAELGHGPLEELLTLVAHGTLHLAGYDDLRPADKKRMFARQSRIVARVLKNVQAKTR
ncbi:MAG: rRNA maturation RNase YbeY [Elusimicrobiota bacterium]|jgi:probable rRNA maturation factor